VICFHDTDGVSGGSEMNHRIWEAVKRYAAQTALANSLEYETPELTQMMVLQKAMNSKMPLSKALAREHVVSRAAVEVALRLADKLLPDGPTRPRPRVLAGIGLGAYFALQSGIALRENGGWPWRLYVINPPAIFPVPKTGALGGCSIRCFLSAHDTSGERWRFAAATRGPCQCEVLGSSNEMTPLWAQRIVDDLVSEFGLVA